MATLFTIVFCIIGALSLGLLWLIAESEANVGCYPILGCIIGLIVAAIGLYFCGTLGQVLSAL